jgi:hypothetical protein
MEVMLKKPIFFTMAQQPTLGQGLLTIENSWSHSDTPHSVGFLWTSDQLVAETSAWNTQHSQQTDIHAADGIRNHSSNNREVTDPRIRRRGHRDPQLCPLRRGADKKLYISLFRLYN